MGLRTILFLKKINKNMFPSNIMFHYFYDGLKHSFVHGALTNIDFELLLNKLISKNILVSATEWRDRFNNDYLEEKICLTFDDGLLSQYDIALPLLDKYKLNAFWFVNTLPLSGKPIYMEIFRKFKHNHFKTVDEYYELFFAAYSQIHKEEIKETDFNGHLNQFNFYSLNDRKYRFIRDKKLTQNEYEQLILCLIENEKWDISSAMAGTWLTESHIKALSNKDHIIGLHSHSHPLNLNQLDYNQQYFEYKTNKDILEQITGKKTDSMAHPINSYNKNTLTVLTELNIKIGFCSNNFNVQLSNLELPRVDHTLIN